MITSKKGREMIQNISSLYTKSGIEQAIYEAIGNEADNADRLVEEVLLQLFPQTATWGLAWWEQRKNLPTNLNEDIEVRRKKVIAKMQTKHPITPERMGSILESFTGIKAIVTEVTRGYTFDVTLVSEQYFNVNIDEVISQIKRIKPSHLGYSLGLETDKTIEVSSERTYVFNSLIMCGEINCGEGLVISTFGRVYESTINSYVDTSTNIKDYSLTGAVLAGSSAELESGVAVIGRVYPTGEQFTSTMSILYENELSKESADEAAIIGTLNTGNIQIPSEDENNIKDYNLAGEISASTEVIL